MLSVVDYCISDLNNFIFSREKLRGAVFSPNTGVSMSNATITLNNHSQFFPKVATSSQQLSQHEQHERLCVESKLKSFLEQKTLRNTTSDFYEIGNALRKLNDQKLYRSSHPSFDLYCEQIIGIKRSQAYRYMYAAATLDNLQFPNGENQQAQILPTTERQIRALNNLEPSLQREVWLTATEKAGGKPPSSRIITQTIFQVLIKYGRVQNSYSCGEVCQIIAKSNLQLKDQNGCWCIVKKIDPSTCTVATWNGECTIRIDHLKSLHYCDTELSMMQLLCERLNKLYNRGNLESAAITVLKQLGRIQRPYLIPLEENLLRILEQT